MSFGVSSFFSYQSRKRRDISALRYVHAEDVHLYKVHAVQNPFSIAILVSLQLSKSTLDRFLAGLGGGLEERHPRATCEAVITILYGEPHAEHHSFGPTYCTFILATYRIAKLAIPSNYLQNKLAGISWMFSLMEDWNE